jgi:transcriptional regulator with XRE-family HTH domain
MAKTIAALLPSTSELLVRFGGRLRLARLRRRLSAKQVAERAGMVPMTLRSVERGGAGVTMGAYLAVMQVLGVENDLEQLAAADPQGRELQDARLGTRARGDWAATWVEASQPEHGVPVGVTSKRTRPVVSQAPPAARARPVVRDVKRKAPSTGASDRRSAETSEFASSTALASLLDPVAPRSRKRR